MSLFEHVLTVWICICFDKWINRLLSSHACGFRFVLFVSKKEFFVLNGGFYCQLVAVQEGIFLISWKATVFYYIFRTFSLVALMNILMSDLVWLKLGFGAWSICIGNCCSQHQLALFCIMCYDLCFSLIYSIMIDHFSLSCIISFSVISVLFFSWFLCQILLCFPLDRLQHLVAH